MKLPRPGAAEIPGAIIALAALIVGALVFGWFLFPFALPVGFDEGYMVSFAERVIDGRWLPYVDGVSHRGPVLYWVLAIAQLVTGRYQWAGIRLVGLFGCVGTVLATYLAGVAARRPLAGALGGAAYVFVLATMYAPGGGIGVHGEPVATPFLALSLCLASFALHRAATQRRRLLLLALAGGALALANLTKQTTAVALLPLLLWALASGWDGRELAPETGWLRRVPARLGSLLAFVVGWGLPFLAVLTWYATHGALKELVYWSLTYNKSVYMHPFPDVWKVVRPWLLDQPFVLVGGTLALVVALARPLALVESWSPRGVARAWARGGFEFTAALLAVLLLVTALMPARFWPHYFIPVFPFFGVVVGVLLEQVMLGVTDRDDLPVAGQAPVALGVVLLVALCGGKRLEVLGKERRQGAWENPRPDPICAQLDHYVRPGEPVFIWGFDGDLYITCRRPPATRFTYTTSVAGIVPPFWTEPRREREPPGARAMLRGDLDRTRPPVILDIPLLGGVTMESIPDLAALLTRDYCPVGGAIGKRGRNPKFFARRDRGLCDPAVPSP